MLKVNSSPLGRWILYTCYLSHKQKRAFAFSKFFGETEIGSQEYCHGFLTGAAAATELVDFTLDDDILTVSEFDEDLAKNLEVLCNGDDRAMKKKFSDWVPVTPKIEAYFRLKEPPVPAAPAIPPAPEIPV